MRMRKIMLSVIALCITTVSFGTVRLPNLLASNMVLQQNARVKLWGWADPAEKIIITTSWNGKADTVTTTRDANWALNVQTPAAGGPYTISFKASNIILLEHIYHEKKIIA